MKFSKYIITAVLVSVVTLLSGCTQDKEKGIAMAADFVKAWNGDSDSLNSQIQKIKSVLDSLTFKSPFINAFIEETSKNDSTIAIAAKVLLKDGDEISADVCDEIIDGLDSGTLNYTQAYSKVMQFFEVCGKLNRDDLSKTFSKMLDNQAASLSLDRQMKVYSSATTPEKLGKALKVDAQSPNADKNLINKQIEALKTIYNTDDYNKFIEAYKKD